MDQRLFRGLNFFDSARAWPACLDRQSDRTTGQAGSGIPSPPQLLLLLLQKEPGTAERRAATAGNANVQPRQPSCLGSSDWLNRPLAL